MQCSVVFTKYSPYKQLLNSKNTKAMLLPPSAAPPYFSHSGAGLEIRFRSIIDNRVNLSMGLFRFILCG